MQRCCTQLLALPLLWWLSWSSLTLANGAPRAVLPVALEAPTPKDLETAKQHYNSGAAWYEQGRYEAACMEFLEAYRLSGATDLLFNLGRSAERMGRIEDALVYLEAYLQRRPEASDRERISDKIVQLRKQLEDEGEAHHREEERKRQEEAARVQKAAAARIPPVNQKAPEQRDTSKLPPWPAMTFIGGGAVLAIIGIGLGAGAVVTAHQVENPTAGMFDRPLDQRGKALSTAGLPFDVVGALALCAGGAWTIYWAVHDRKQPRTHAVLRPRRLDLTGLALQGSF